MTKEELEKEAEEKCVCKDEAMRIMYRIGYIDGAEPREKQLDEFRKENAELKAKIYGGGYDAVIAKKDADIILLEKQNSELKKQIEKMKCCGNCKNGELSAHEEPCPHCQRCFASADVTDQENVSDKWELADD